VRYRRWRPPPIMSGGNQVARFRPDFETRVRLKRTEHLFAIGSCFARNVEAFLPADFQVPSRMRASDIPAAIAAIHRDLTTDRTIWHRYNAFSIRNSIEWALTPDAPAVRHRLMEVGPGLSVDPYAGWRTILATGDAQRVSSWIDTTMAAVRGCRTVIVTLGLSEIWEDCQTGIVMNATPLAQMWQSYPDRFRFRVASCDETLEQLEVLHSMLSLHCVADFQVVVSVSPIPLGATFREMDVVVANAASKAVLRAAADQWSRQHENVHYFPSYEIILSSSQTGTWMDDFRHCSIDVIKYVMEVFLSDFVEFECD
jgi:hypothetical protein